MRRCKLPLLLEKGHHLHCRPDPVGCCHVLHMSKQRSHLQHLPFCFLGAFQARRGDLCDWNTPRLTVGDIKITGMGATVVLQDAKTAAPGKQHFSQLWRLPNLLCPMAAVLHLAKQSLKSPPFSHMGPNRAGQDYQLQSNQLSVPHLAQGQQGLPLWEFFQGWRGLILLCYWGYPRVHLHSCLLDLQLQSFMSNIDCERPAVASSFRWP